MSGGKGACRFTAGIQDGCRVTVRSNRGCGTLTFRSTGAKRDLEEFVQAEEVEQV